MADKPSGWVVQLCPNDHPPFLDICQVYESAAESLGCKVLTVFFSPPLGERTSACYLDLEALNDNRKLGRKLADSLAEELGETVPLLTLCHRYRALRGHLASRRKSRVTVALAHEFGFFKRASRRIARRMLFPREVSYAGVSVPVCDELARHVPKPLLLPNGIDTTALEDVRLSRSGAREVLGVRDDAFVVGVVGRLHPKKQPRLAIEGFRTALPDLPDPQMVFIGEGELRSELESQSSDLPIVFAGFVPGAARCFPGLDVLLIASGEREAFGLVALEAMASGLPVVAGPSPGPRSVLAENGFYYEEETPAAVAAVLCDVARFARENTLVETGKQGVERVKREFSISAVASRLDALLQPVAMGTRQSNVWGDDQ